MIMFKQLQVLKMMKIVLSRQKQAVLTVSIILNRSHELLWLKQSQQTEFLVKCGTNRFHKLQSFFWIKRCSGKEKNSGPKTVQGSSYTRGGLPKTRK